MNNFQWTAVSLSIFLSSMKFPHEVHQFPNTLVCIANNLTINTVLPKLAGKK